MLNIASRISKIDSLFRNIFSMKDQTNILWGRWCLPSFNKHCDQILKGKLADYDNNLCNGKPLCVKHIGKERKY